MTPRIQIVIFVMLALLVSAWLRFEHLGDTPLQFDEAVNWHQSGLAKYSPTQFHGPLYFKLLQVFGRDSEAEVRFGSAGAGVLLTASPLLLLGLVPGSAIFALMLLLAVDPLLVFYSRTAIHESLFLLISASIGFLFLRLLMGGSLWLLPLLGVLAGLLATTKESFPLVLFGISVASLVIRRRLERRMIFPLLASIATGIITCMLVFWDIQAPIDILRGVFAWSGHSFDDQSQRQPWWYFFGLLYTVDAAILLALFLALFRASPQQRFFLLWGAIVLLAHSILPYKTPWLAINFTVPIYAAFVLSVGSTILPAILSVLLIINPFGQSLLIANATSSDVPKLANRIVNYCKPLGSQCRVFVNLKWYWPLPFYLRKINSQVAYTESSPPPPVPIDTFSVLIFPVETRREIPNWRREEVTFSRLQRAAVYWRQPSHN